METWSEGSAKVAGAYQIGREEVPAGTDRMIVNVPTGADYAIKVNGVDQVTISPTGSSTFAGDMAIASGKVLSSLGGAANLDWSASSGLFKTSSGLNTLGGSVVGGGGTTTVDFSSSSGTFKTSSGTNTLSGNTDISGTIHSTGVATFDSTASFGGAVTFLGGYTGQPSLLATVTSINLKNTGTTNLYTVPGGKTLLVLDVIIYATSVSAVIAAPIVRVGKTPLYTEFLALTTLTGVDATSKVMSLSGTALNLVSSSFAAGEILALNVGTGATATTLTASAYVIGILI